MVERGHKFRGNVIGGFTDLAEHFNCTVECRPLVPAVGCDRVVFAIHDEGNCRVLSVYRETMGYFMQDRKSDVGKLRRLLVLAKNIIETNGREVVASKVTVSDRDEPVDARLLDECHDALTALSTVLNTRNTHAKSEDRIQLMAKCVAGIIYLPHNAFVELGAAYVAAYNNFNEGVLDDAYTYASALHVEMALPQCIARMVYAPLFVPKFYDRLIEPEDGPCYTELYSEFPVFRGFGYKVNETTTTPWNGFDGETCEMELAIDITDERKLLDLVKINDRVRTAIASVAASDKHTSPEWISARDRLHDVLTAFDEHCFASQTPYVKTVKNFFSTHMGVAILQNQLNLITPVWPVSAAPTNPTALTEEAKLAFLKRVTSNRMSETSKLILAHPENVMRVVDVVVDIKDTNNDFGCLPQHDAPAATNPANNTVKLKYVMGSTAAVKAFAAADAWFETSPPNSTKTPKIDKLLILGLWSPYNSTEFSEWGNLSAVDPAKQTAYGKSYKDPLLNIDVEHFNNWWYYIKTVPLSEPCGVMSWLYNARLIVLSTIGATVAMCWSTFRPGNKIHHSVLANTQLLTIMATMRSETTRGAFARVKAPQGSSSTGNTFDLVAPVMASKAPVLTRSHQPRNAVNTNEFNKLEWMGNCKSDDKLTERFKYLKKTYNVPRLLHGLQRQMSFFYKRISFTRYQGIKIRDENFIKNKKSYVYSPTAYVGSMKVCTGSWCTTGLEATAPWMQILVYKVLIEPNTFIYSKEQISEWTSFSDNGAVAEVDWQDYAAMLLKDAGDCNVCTSDINQYTVPKATYLVIVDYLSKQNRYTVDCEPEYATDNDAASACGGYADDDPEDVGCGLARHAQKRDADTVLNTLENSLRKRRMLTSDFEGQDDE